PYDNADGMPTTKMSMPMIQVIFFRFLRSSFVVEATMISSIEKADVNAANKNNNKKMNRKNAPNGILSNTAGRTTNNRPGPSVGSKLKEKTAGKIASPANSEMAMFIETTVKADFGKSSFLDKYELYVTMTETPTLMAKKDCPNANNMV